MGKQLLLRFWADNAEIAGRVDDTLNSGQKNSAIGISKGIDWGMWRVFKAVK